MLAEHVGNVSVVNAKTPADDILQMNPDGIFLSNGPGDPEPCDYAIKNIQKFGMMNIGFNPTFGNKKLTIEVNIFDFEQDVYGENVRIEFIKFIRNEIRFHNIDELIKQIKIDRETCKSYMNSTYNN